MPRKVKVQEDHKFFESEVVRVFQLTGQQERFEIAQKWCLGERENHIGFAEARGLLPMALITGALIDVEHPLTVDERGCLRGGDLFGCSVLILQATVEGSVVHIPCVQVGVVHREGQPIPIKWELSTISG